MAEPGTLGLDLGGAHLKAARLGPDGTLADAFQLACPLWRGTDRLEQALGQALARLGPVERVAVTMTGELVDLFPDRASGVSCLVAAVERHLPGIARYWAGTRGFLEAGAAAGAADAVASANWLATASAAAVRAGEGLLVDMGSTTTDLLVLAGGRPCPMATGDRGRLASGELVYQGLVRTPVMALARKVPLAGAWTGLMNEHFATTADLYRLLGLLDEADDVHPAADGGAKDVEASARRLARMAGADLAELPMGAWRAMAGFLVQRQLRLLEDAAALQLSRGLLDGKAPVIGAGCGEVVTELLARRLERPFLPLSALFSCPPALRRAASVSAPALAVALLLHEAGRALSRR